MIEFRNVSASNDGELPVLRDVSLIIPDGDFVAFAGTNGAGKSTTMRLINGLLKPTSGEVLLDGVPTTALRTSEVARKVGFLFQNPDRQICQPTVREELLFGFTAARASCWRWRPSSGASPTWWCSTSRRRGSTTASARR